MNPLFKARMEQRGAPPIPEEYQRIGPPAPPSAPPPETDDTDVHEEFERVRIAAAKKREARPASFRRFLPKPPAHPKKAPQHTRVENDSDIVQNSHKNQPLPPFVDPSLNGHGAFQEETDTNNKARPSSYSRFLPKLSPRRPQEPEDELEQLTNEKHKHSSFRSFLPKAPAIPPPSDISQAVHDEFEYIKSLALGKKKMAKASPQNVDQYLSEELERQRDAALRPNSRRLSKMARAVSGHRFFTDSKDSRFYEDDKAVIAKEDLQVEPVPVIAEPVFKSTCEWITYSIKYHHALERSLMAGIAICLLWLTSLIVAQSIVYGLFKGPLLTEVIQNITNTYNDTLDLSNRYVACVIRESDKCNNTFNLQLTNEVQRTASILDGDTEAINSYVNSRGNCSNSFGDVIKILDYLINVKKVNLNPEFTIGNFSGNPQCATVTQKLSDQIIAINTLQTATAYQSSINSYIASFQEQYNVLASYDSGYVSTSSSTVQKSGPALNNKVPDPSQSFNNLQTSRNLFFACTADSGTYGGAQCSHASMMQSANTLRSSLAAQYSNLVSQSSQHIGSVVAQFTPLETFYVNFKNALSGIAGLKAQLDTAANAHASTQGNGLSGLGYVDINPSILPLPSFMDPASFSSAIGTTADLSAQNAAGQNSLLQSSSQTLNSFQGYTGSIKNGQSNWQGTFFADYNPPPYDVNTTSSSWVQTSSQYPPELQQELHLVSARVAPAVTNTYQPTNDTSQAEVTANTLLPTHLLSSWTLYGYNFNYNFIMIQLSNFNNLALILDYTYRAFRSISIALTYWKVSAVLAPPADVRVGDHSKGVLQKKQVSPDVATANLVTNPVIDLLLALLFVAIGLSIFVGVYVPLFEDYVNGCKTLHSNGTMITNNYYSVSFAAAVSAGDSLISSDIDRVNIKRELLCTKNENLVSNQMQNLQQQWNFNYQQTVQLQQSVEAFKACVNTSKIDLTYGSSLSLAATNGTTSSVNAALYTPFCNYFMTPLNQSVFECNNIQACSPAGCRFSNDSTLYTETFLTGCIIERFIHASILGTFLSIFAYILMNLSRWTFLHGLRRAFMSHFAVPQYSYLATTNEFGEIEYPEIIKDKAAWSTLIRDELSETIKQFQRSGILLSIFAICLNIPWIIAVVILANQFNSMTTNLQ